MFSYDGLNRLLKDKNLTKTCLAHALGISSRTIAKINKGQKIADRVLIKIADYLNCDVDQLCKEISQNELLQQLRDEKDAKISGGIYHELQVRMTYNSNHIEGSTLTQDQTRMIFETSTIDAGDGVPVDDIIETVNHFRAIDFVIDCAEEPLSEQIIKHIHSILKQGTKDSALAWFAVGDYKLRPNFVGGKKTAASGQVAPKMQNLLKKYESKAKINIADIVEFHYQFEAIHPFQDGNGRVGRLIALKECLRHNIVPFIIEDAKKSYYYRGLNKFQSDKAYLLDTCRDGQDTFKRMMDEFEIK